jgi:hypothetical protein
MPDVVALWDGSIGPSPPEPLIKASLGERRARCVKEILMLSELIETFCHDSAPAAVEFVRDATLLRSRLLLWLTRYCNEFRQR